MINWKLIETIPEMAFVWAYCKKAAGTAGAASQTKGGMVVCYRPPAGDLPGEFVDHYGVTVNWDFTHWVELPQPPGALCDRHNFKLSPIAGGGTYCTKCGFTVLIDD